MKLHRFRRLFVGLSIFFWIILAPAPIYAAEPRTGLTVGQVQVVEDASATATLEQIIAQLDQFRDLNTNAPDYRFTASAYWLRIPVQNQRSAAATFYFDIKNTLINDVQFYMLPEHGDPANAAQQVMRSGTDVPGRLRPYLATSFVFPFQLAGQERTILYVRVHSTGVTLQIPFFFHDEGSQQISGTAAWVLSSVLVSMLAAMFLYNLLLLTLIRTRLYLYYVLYLSISVLGVAILGGVGPMYLYPNSTWLSNQGLPFLTAFAYALMILITRTFTGIDRGHRLNRWSQLLIAWALFLSVGALLWPLPLSYQMLITMTFVYPIFCFGAGIMALRRGYKEARFFIIGQISSWTGLVLTGLLGASVLSYHPLLYQSSAIGAVIDSLLLSLALGDRFRILQKARIHAEEQARRNLEIRSEELERLVAARTAEIKTLHGILPICANCKKIRNDEGAWQGLETYISQHTDAEFSHGICADCMEQLYPEFSRKRTQKSLN